MEQYIVFEAFNDEYRQCLIKRAMELGYDKFRNLDDKPTITLDTEGGELWWSTLPIKINHEMGDIKLFFSSDHYRYRKPLKIGGHDVQMDKRGIVVGCQTVPKETVERIIEEWNKING